MVVFASTNKNYQVTWSALWSVNKKFAENLDEKIISQLETSMWQKETNFSAKNS